MEVIERLQTEELMQIGELARRCEVTPRTVKYYEELGLLRPAAKSEGGFRLYNSDNLQRLQRIKQMIAAGLSLAAISELMQLIDTISGQIVEEMQPQERVQFMQELDKRIIQLGGQIKRQEAELQASRRLQHDLQTALDNLKYYQTHGKWLSPELNNS
jgi:DNA-binding transcriptional MerR regulator